MKVITIYACENCERHFSEQGLAAEHKKKCPKLRVGDKIKFLLGLILAEGVITRINEPYKFGEAATVDVETKEELDEVDFLHDGKHFRVDWEDVTGVVAGKETPAKEAA